MDWSWLGKALKDTALEVLRYIFVWDKQAEVPGPGEDEKRLKDKIKKDGW